MLKIPDIIGIKYAEVMDSFLESNLYTVPCQLVYNEQIEVIDNQMPLVRQNKTMNLQDMHPSNGFKRGDKSFRTIETTENISLRMYWEKKDFQKFGHIQVQDGVVMTITKYENLDKFNKAIALLVCTDKTSHQEWRFIKSAEPIVHGLNNNYLMAFWRRA
jgi:hypothetical protein